MSLNQDSIVDCLALHVCYKHWSEIEDESPSIDPHRFGQKVRDESVTFAPLFKSYNNTLLFMNACTCSLHLVEPVGGYRPSVEI